MPEVSAETARIRQAIDTIAAYAEYAEAIGQNFRAGIAPTRAWPGENDDFARQIRPIERQEADTARSTSAGLAAVVAGIQRGVDMTLGALTGMQGDALDAIDEHANRQRNGRS
ncbi:hypothetical protein [Streptomyces cadmiisoli]|uniref:WXG100 family type VII secretion target n=1 Tax=Streptomyces cadmiisoli TaxID=2184053 RepID=A0A2Z4JEX0_9ACTN|nr:hypothetical protein [Streptomyces cadmiisoli]AWW43378.1 hypothetical protein DN051_43210 [Streptomyces cadmiisoli]